MPAIPRTVAAFCAITLSMLAVATADDSFYRVRIDELKIDGPRPTAVNQQDWRFRGRNWAMFPYIVLDQPGEAYLDSASLDNIARFAGPFPVSPLQTVCVRAAKPGDIAGRLFWPKVDWSGMTEFKFTIPAQKASDDARVPFYQAKERYYNVLLHRDIPGGAWFRHEIGQAQMARNEKKTDATLTRPAFNVDNPRGIARTYELFSGGRAVSENLQLDRVVRETKPEAATVDINTIPGITVKEIDWKPLIKDLKPALDPLAESIPADQHVIFFPTFSAAVVAADQAEPQGTPVLHLAEPRSEDARTTERYQRQLGLSLSGVGRLLGPSVAKSVALTGSDLYFRTGTDVAILFEAPNPELLENLLLAQVKMSAAKIAKMKWREEFQGDANGLKYHCVCTPDHVVSSYIARSGNAVIVTNSRAQLKRLADVAAKKTPSIASLPEYTFFRDRYKLGDPEETGFVFLSDATIRRWCGPRWRIATSRQTRDLGVLTELQAANLDRLVKHNIESGPIYTDFATADIGQLTLDNHGVRSSVQGSLDFLTPIVEIPLDKVTQAESVAYGQWRDGYQQNWSWAFDPIALRLTLKQNRMAADLTVMPLILGTQYREFASISSGAKIAPDAGDPHDALLHFILAINTKSNQFRQAENLISTMSSGVTLGWIGSSVAFYADDDPIWEEMAKLSKKELNDSYVLKNFHRLPIAAQIEVSSGFRLAAFLAAARTWIEQAAPGMVGWETLKYKDQPYVKITPTERAKSRGREKEMENAALYYVATGDALLLTPNEGLLKRALDRQLARKEAAKNGEKSTPSSEKIGRPWLGSSVAVQIDRKAIGTIMALIDRVGATDRQAAMQARAWSNLPILNEWHRLYPDRDPVEVHERVWKIRPICPGGGKYVWNEKYQTMESTVYGHPGEPKAGPVVVPLLSEFSTGSFGLTFENDGLRARVSLERGAPAKEAAKKADSDKAAVKE